LCAERHVPLRESERAPPLHSRVAVEVCGSPLPLAALLCFAPAEYTSPLFEEVQLLVLQLSFLESTHRPGGGSLQHKCIALLEGRLFHSYHLIVV
jgi:hypothetical protein